MKVLNVDLSQELSKDQLKILETAFTEHLVLVFRQVKFHWSYFSSQYFSDIQTKHTGEILSHRRNQTLTPAQQIAFTKLWGNVEPHPLGSRADTHPEGVPKEVGG